jgi:hypothetical protein
VEQCAKGLAELMRALRVCVRICAAWCGVGAAFYATVANAAMVAFRAPLATTLHQQRAVHPAEPLNQRRVRPGTGTKRRRRRRRRRSSTWQWSKRKGRKEVETSRVEKKVEKRGHMKRAARKNLLAKQQLVGNSKQRR